MVSSLHQIKLKNSAYGIRFLAELRTMTRTLQLNALQLLDSTFRSSLIVMAVPTGLAGWLLISVESVVATLALLMSNKLCESLIPRELPLAHQAFDALDKRTILLLGLMRSGPVTAMISSRGSAFKFTLELTPTHARLYGFIAVMPIGHHSAFSTNTSPPCARIMLIPVFLEPTRVWKRFLWLQRITRSILKPQLLKESLLKR
jgi:hypothetical protein